MYKVGTFLLLLLFAGCSTVSRPTKFEEGIIAADSVPLNNSTGQVALRIATLRQGETVDVLERRKDQWVKIRSAQGIEGWIEARHLIRKDMVARANALADEVKDISTQAIGRATGYATLRLSPGRATEDNAIFSIPTGTLVEVLDRRRTLRESNEVLPRSELLPAHRQLDPPDSGSKPGLKYDPWYQVRLPGHPLVRAGWVYAPLIELQIPQRLIHFQGAYNIIGWFPVGQVEDSDVGTAVHYLTLERDRFHPRLETDFDRVALYIWDRVAHSYSSSLQRIQGILPVKQMDHEASLEFVFKSFDQKSRLQKDVSLVVDLKDPERPRLIRPKS
jgi:hypothetical protein